MTFDIVIGRNKSDMQKFGTKGTILLAKQYVKMGQVTSLSNKVYMDVAKAHVIFVCGKRGGGKSYSMGVIAEGMASLPEEVRKNLSFVLLDTMGIYWTMKYPNHKDEELLNQWGLKGEGLDVQIFTPEGYYHQYKEKGIPTDFPFSIKPSELNALDWCLTFDTILSTPLGVAIESTVNELNKKGKDYSIDNMIEYVKTSDFSKETKDALINRLKNTETWGLFSENGTKLKELVVPGKVSILDVSCYATAPNGWAIKSLVIGLVAEKLFIQRMTARKSEEYATIHESMHYFSKPEEKEKMPLVWLVIDEAHEFLPREGKTVATDALVTILREGRQPGISLILATQQPAKIHTDVMTQSDILISHVLTAKMDIDALGMLMQSYMRAGLDKEYNNLPKVKGSAIIIDDQNERLYSVRVRPRISWHGGEAPIAIKEEKKVFEW